MEPRWTPCLQFDSTLPHRLYNAGDKPVNAIWFVVGREADERPPRD